MLAFPATRKAEITWLFEQAKLFSLQFSSDRKDSSFATSIKLHISYCTTDGVAHPCLFKITFLFSLLFQFICIPKMTCIKFYSFLTHFTPFVSLVVMESNPLILRRQSQTFTKTINSKPCWIFTIHGLQAVQLANQTCIMHNSVINRKSSLVAFTIFWCMNIQDKDQEDDWHFCSNSL